MESFMLTMNGRIGRARYFLTILGLTIVMYIISFAVGIIGGSNGASDEGIGATAYLISIVFTVVMAFSVVRRFHDLDRPGTHYWLLLIPLYNIYVSLVLLFQKGTLADNKYGPNTVTS